MRKIDKIIIHHSLTNRQSKTQWAAIRKYHKQHNGWSDIGYHYGIELIKNSKGEWIAKERKGRLDNKAGAHVKGMNRNTLGICVVGNFDRTVVPKRLWLETLHLVRRLQRAYDVDIENVLGHWEAQRDQGIDKDKRKSCPGTQFNMVEFRRGLL